MSGGKEHLNMIRRVKETTRQYCLTCIMLMLTGGAFELLADVKLSWRHPKETVSWKVFLGGGGWGGGGGLYIC